MRFDVITLFPELVESVIHSGVTARAAKNNLIELHCWNPRDYASDVHLSVDDRPYGGGPGMVMKADCLLPAIRDAKSEATRCLSDTIEKLDNNAKNPLSEEPRVIYLSPQGRPLKQGDLCTMSGRQGLVLVCGRYEGIDERVLELEVDEQWSLGDYVLSGGELGAMVIIDAITRLLPGALGHAESANEDSFGVGNDGLLDCPHYTRPDVIEGLYIPPVLKSGNHQAIARWRRKQSLGRTNEFRPDFFKKLLENKALSSEDKLLLEEYLQDNSIFLEEML